MLSSETLQYTVISELQYIDISAVCVCMFEELHEVKQEDALNGKH